MKKAYLIPVFILFISITTLNAQEWETDFTMAKENASEKHLPIILVFQGSDWCAPCIKLDKEVWSTQEFQNYAKNHFVMLKADFPRKKKNTLPAEQEEQNKKLAETYNKNGFFPFVVVMNEKGKVLGETGYKKLSAPEYIELLSSFLK